MQIAFAVAAGVAAATLLAVAFDRIQRRALVVLAVLAGLAAVAAWVGFGLRRGTSTATAAGGITIAFVAQLAAVKLRDLLRTARRFDDQLARAQGRINSLIAREADERNAELERTLVRARADTASILAEQERRMAEERRVAAAEHARLAEDELGKALTAAQQQVEARLIGWTDDLERRQLEQLERIVSRATSSYSDAATQQFADTVKSSREAAAVRLSRELDRAVQAFAREAQTVLADRLAQVGDAGAQRLERRQAQVAAGLDRQRTEAIEAFEARLLQAEQELRRRLDTLAADTEAERAVLDARLRELAKRLDETLART